MFYNYSSLTSLNLSNFNTNIVQDMSNMFDGLKENCDIITTNKELLNLLTNLKN